MQFCDPQAGQNRRKIPNSFSVLKFSVSFQLMQIRETISKRCMQRLEVKMYVFWYGVEIVANRLLQASSLLARFSSKLALSLNKPLVSWVTTNRTRASAWQCVWFSARQSPHLCNEQISSKKNPKTNPTAPNWIPSLLGSFLTALGTPMSLSCSQGNLAASDLASSPEHSSPQ